MWNGPQSGDRQEVKSRPRSPWLWLGGLGLLTCAGSCTVGAFIMLVASLGPELAKHRSSPTVRPEEFRQTLARLRASVPEPPELAEVPCPDAEILRVAKERVATGLQGEAVLGLWKVTYESLAEFADRGPTDLERPGLKLMPSREELGLEPVPDTGPDDWSWLDGLGSTHVFHPNLYEGYHREADLQYTMRDVLSRRYLVVLRSSTRTMPRILNGGVGDGFRRRELRSGESFTPGVFRGALVVMDIEAASVVCQAPLEVHSSASLVYRTRGLLRRQPSRTLRGDFQDHFRDAGRASLGRISKVLQAW